MKLTIIYQTLVVPSRLTISQFWIMYLKQTYMKFKFKFISVGCIIFYLNVGKHFSEVFFVRRLRLLWNKPTWEIVTQLNYLLVLNKVLADWRMRPFGWFPQRVWLNLSLNITNGNWHRFGKVVSAFNLGNLL